MKKIKLFALPSHVTKERMSGVDFVRIVQPMEYLGKHEDFETYVYDPVRDEKMNWIEVAEQFDIFYLNYTTDAWNFAKMGMFARKHGKKLVMDLDDALWNVKQDNISYTAFKKGSEGLKNLTAMVNEVDYITCTNQYLKHVIMNNTKKKVDRIAVFDNAIDLDNLYTHRSPFKDELAITIMWFGSTTHYIDLETEAFLKGMDRIFKEFPNVTFKTIGSTSPKFRYMWGGRYSHDFGHQDLYTWVRQKYPVFMDEADIVVAPLSDTIYDRAKSAIKFLEYGAAKKPGVYQRIRQYEEVVVEGVNGYLASTSGEWYEALKNLIIDAKHRRVVGEKAFQTVETHQMKDKVEEYAQFFHKVIDKQENLF